MATIQNVTFTVNDDGGAEGPDPHTKTFAFDTIQRGAEYEVTVTIPGSGQQVYTLSKEKGKDQVDIVDNGARVKPSGKLTLSHDSAKDEEQVLILFTGALITMHSVAMKNVCIGAID